MTRVTLKKLKSTTLMSLENWLLKFEIWHNRASDTKFVWFPFEFLRPPVHVKIDAKRCLAMALCFGTYFAAFALLKDLFFGREFTVMSTSFVFLKATGAFFIWFKFVTAYFWNRRANSVR